MSLETFIGLTLILQSKQSKKKTLLFINPGLIILRNNLNINTVHKK